jgi:uncharacterized membrane protein
MKKIIALIKTTAIGGLLVIIPLTIIFLVVAQLFVTLHGFATSIVARFSIETQDAFLIVLVATLSLVGLCFLTGLVVQTSLGKAVRGWFATNVAPRIPMYDALSNLTQRFVGQGGVQFMPVEVDLYGSGARVLAFLVEKLPDNRCAVFVPTSPVTTVGNLYIVPVDSVKHLEASLGDTIGIISQWGVGAYDLYGGKPTT